MAELAIGVVGLAGLFTTCLEGYKTCLSINNANKDAKLLRTRIYLERERFLNIGRTCGLVEHRGLKGRTETLQKFLDEDELRRRAIGDTLELIATLLGEAEDLDRKYASLGRTPLMSSDRETKKGWFDRFQHIRVSSSKVAWSVKDKAAYEGILEHLEGFNTTLEKVLPGPLQEFLKSVLPATVCATTEEEDLSSVEEASARQDLVRAQAEWSDAIRSSRGFPMGPKLDGTKYKLRIDIAKGSRIIVSNDEKALLLIDWTPWGTESQDRATRLSEVAGVLSAGRRKELRLLPCVGYLEEHNHRSEQARYALAYNLPSESQSTKVKSLLELLSTFETVQVPPLEHRVGLARILCRAMLLWHSSGWIHHDFRSHNIVFTNDPPAIGGVVQPKVTDCQGVDIAEPFLAGFGHARDEADISIMFADKKAISKTLKRQRRYWSPDYLTSSSSKRTNRSFQRSHDIYSLGCVLLEIGVWKPLDSYSWDSSYEEDHKQWYRRLVREEGKLRARCGSIYAEAVMTCLRWATSDLETDVQALAFDILLKLEEIKV